MLPKEYTLMVDALAHLATYTPTIQAGDQARHQRDMEIARTERGFPVFGRALANIAQLGGAGGHTLLEPGWKAGERLVSSCPWRQARALSSPAQGQRSPSRR